MPSNRIAAEQEDVFDFFSPGAEFELDLGMVTRPTDWADALPYDPAMPPPLYQLIAKPQPGSYVLSPAWSGREQIVARTGDLVAAQKWTQGQGDRPLRFNLFTFFEEDESREPGRGTLSYRDADNKLRDLYRHRDRLPDNDRIVACRSRPELQALLGTGEGLEVWGAPEELHTSESWHFFTLKDASTIATLSVYCRFTHRPNMPDWAIDGLRIARGTAVLEAR